MTGGTIKRAGCIMPEKLKCALQKYYKHTDFRPGQLESLLPIVHSKDTFVKLLLAVANHCMFLVTKSILSS